MRVEIIGPLSRSIDTESEKTFHFSLSLSQIPQTKPNLYFLLKQLQQLYTLQDSLTCPRNELLSGLPNVFYIIRSAFTRHSPSLPCLSFI